MTSLDNECIEHEAISQELLWAIEQPVVFWPNLFVAVDGDVMCQMLAHQRLQIADRRRIDAPHAVLEIQDDIKRAAEIV
jgi:hypothetical protein